MGTRPARKPNKLGKMPIRVATGTAAFCVAFALLHKLWLPLSFKQEALHASSIVKINDGLPSLSSSLQTDSPSTFSSSSSSDVVQEEMVDSLGDRNGDVVVKALSSDPLVDQEGQQHVKDEEEHEKDEQDKKIDEADKHKDGSQEEDKGERQRYEEDENKGWMRGGWKEGEEVDNVDYDDDFLSGVWKDDEGEDDDDKDEEEEVINTVKAGFAAESNLVTKANIAEEKKKEAIPSLAECQSNYGERRFLHVDEKALPPILYSFPGE